MTTSATPTSPPPPEVAAPAPQAAPRAAAPARWRPPVAVAVVVGLVAGQAAAFAVILAAGGREASDEAAALGLVLADLIVLGIIVAFAARGAERLSPATLGVRRTRFWPALGWAAAMWVAISALSALWVMLVGGLSGEQEKAPAATLAMLLMLLGVAITARSRSAATCSRRSPAGAARGSPRC